MKEMICTGAGLVGAAISGFIGGLDLALKALCIFMAIDYISGLICAGVLHRSPKTVNGALESKACWKGLVRKCMALLMVLVAHLLDLLLGTAFVKDGVCTAFIVSEVISITENAGLMGVPMPAVMQNAIEMLQKKGDNHGNDDNEKD